MHAYLITGIDKEGRSSEVGRLLDSHLIPQISLITLNPPHTIATIRELGRRLNIKAYGKTRAVVIEDAHKMTHIAQNAFLKTLEEPPKDTIIILSSLSEDALLPTIRSRCISLIAPISQSYPTPEILKEQKQLFTKLTEAGIGEKISFVEGVKGRDEAVAFVEGQLLHLHERLKNTSGVGFDSPEVERIGKALLSALSDLRANVNPKMTLFELFKSY